MHKKRQAGHSKVKSSHKAEVKHIEHKDHVKKISYDYESRTRKLQVYDLPEKKVTHPLGIRVLTGYWFIMLGFYFFYLFIGIKTPIAIVFGQMVGGLTALFLVMALIVVIIVLIAGLVKRKKWSYYLSLIWFSFGIINSLVSMVLLKTEVVSFTRSFLILSSVTVFVINILAILYIASEKNYFFSKHFAQKKPMLVDKLFVAALVIFLVVTISIGGVMGYDFYRTNIQQTDGLILELKDKPYDQQIQICSSKQNTQKDLCLLIVSIKMGSSDLCSQIQSDFYKFSCMQA